MTEMALVLFYCICSLSEVEWNILAGGQLPFVDSRRGNERADEKFGHPR